MLLDSVFLSPVPAKNPPLCGKIESTGPLDSFHLTRGALRNVNDHNYSYGIFQETQNGIQWSL